MPPRSLILEQSDGQPTSGRFRKALIQETSCLARGFAGVPPAPEGLTSGVGVVGGLRTIPPAESTRGWWITGVVLSPELFPETRFLWFCVVRFCLFAFPGNLSEPPHMFNPPIHHPFKSGDALRAAPT